MQKFDTYIRKLVKQVHPDFTITADSVEQLNVAINYIGNSIVDEAVKITKAEKKKTIGVREIRHATQIILPGELAKHSVSEANKTVYKFSHGGKGTGPIASRAGLQFPPVRAEHIIRDRSNLNMAKGAHVYLAAVLEYLAAELLTLSGNGARDNKRNRINVRDLYLATQNDEEIQKLFKKLRIDLSGGGVVPNIRQQQLPKKGQKQYEMVDGSRRALPGTAALKDIRKMQKTSRCLIFPKESFQRLVREIGQDFRENFNYSADGMTVLQYHIEQRMIQQLQAANDIAIRAGRTTVQPGDLQLARRIRGD